MNVIALFIQDQAVTSFLQNPQPEQGTKTIEI